MKKSLDSRNPLLDAVLVIGLLLSIGLGLFVALVSPGTTKLLALVVGLLGTVLTFQLDNLRRLERRFDAEDGRLRLLKAIEAYPRLLPEITHIVETASTTLKSGVNDEFTAEIHECFRSMRSNLIRLANGQMLTKDGNTTWMESRIHEVTRSIHSTSFATDLDWWASPSGQRYMEENLMALSRGASIERIFILDDDFTAFKEVMRNQSERGIGVFIASPSKLPIELVRNFAIYDEMYLVEDQVNASGTVTGYLHSKNESDLIDAVAAFARLRTLSNRFETS